MTGWSRERVSRRPSRRLWVSLFPAPPDIPATQRPLLGWAPTLKHDTLTLIRPVAWAKAVGGLRFRPSRWGRAFRLEADGGTHLIIRRHGASELTLWLPDELAPAEGKPFGVYVHSDLRYGARASAAARFRRAIGIGPALPIRPFRHAHRHAAMLAIADATSEGRSLYDIAATFLPAMPVDWSSSSERSDLRRIRDAGARMWASSYVALLAGNG